MNAHVRDQLNALKTPAGGYSVINEASDYTTTSTSFTDIDATDLNLTFTTGGGDVLVGFTGECTSNTLNEQIYFELSVDGTALAGDDGLTVVSLASNTGNAQNASFVVRVTGLSADQHIFKLQWKTGSGTATLHAGAGTAGYDTHPRFWAKEIA